MYNAGGFMFPTTTGPYSVSGLGFTPQAVLMFGTNSSTMDSLEAYPGGTSYPGMFVSLSAENYLDADTVTTLCVSISGATQLGDVAQGWAGIYPVRMCTTSGQASADYRADSITFDFDGFTLDVTDGASADRWVHWFAVGEHFLGGAKARPLSGTWSNSYAPKSGLFLTTTAQSEYTDQVYNGEGWLSFGAGSFPFSNESDWTTALSYVGVLLGSALGRQGYVYNFPVGGYNIESVHALGPVLLEDLDSITPTAAGSTTMSGGVEFLNYTQAAWWDGDSRCDSPALPASGDTVHVDPPAEFTETQAVIFMGTNNVASNSSTTHDLSYTIGVLTEDYQGCVAFTRYGELFQSATACAVRAENTDLAVATGDLSSGSGYDLIGITGSGSGVLAIQFGGDTPRTKFLPQIYRRW